MSGKLPTIAYGINLNHKKFSEFTQEFDYLLKSYFYNGTELQQFWIGVELTPLREGKIVSLFKLKLTPSEQDKLELDNKINELLNNKDIDQKFKKLIKEEKPDIFIVWSYD
jgi:hypothetical protein